MQIWYSQNGYADMDAYRSSTHVEGKSLSANLQHNYLKILTSNAHPPHPSGGNQQNLGYIHEECH